MQASRRGWKAWLGLVAVSSVMLSATAAESGAVDPFTNAVGEMLAEGKHPYLVNPDGLSERSALETLYVRREWRPLWSDGTAPTRAALALISALRGADSYGLRSPDYEANRILYQLVDLITTPGAQPARWAQFDLALSAEALRFITHLHYGRVDPRAVGFNIAVAPDRIDRLSILEELGATVDPSAVFARIEPPFEHYRLLKQTLSRFRLLALEPGLAELPPLPARSVKAGETYTGAPQLRRLLIALGNLPPDSSAADTDLTLDPELVAALQRFQTLHGLTPDGAMGKETYRQLTTPLVNRVEQIEITLERWRWLPRLDTPPIIVNIPQYRLFAFGTTEDREADMLKMDVIVGRNYPNTRTPIFTEELRHVIFRPYWDVPYSITTRELLPEIRNNPAYLERNHFEIVRGGGDDAKPVPPTPENLALLASGGLRLRQKPGDDNALGLVKFMLPNAYNVYLHSTPARGLFRESRRAFSHGCIRVSDPVALAVEVLKNTPGDWTREKVEAAMSGTQNNVRVNLAQPIRVFVLYGTAIVSEAGDVFFFDDVYGHDAKLAAMLAS